MGSGKAAAGPCRVGVLGCLLRMPNCQGQILCLVCQILCLVRQILCLVGATSPISSLWPGLGTIEWWWCTVACRHAQEWQPWPPSDRRRSTARRHQPHHPHHGLGGQAGVWRPGSGSLQLCSAAATQPGPAGMAARPPTTLNPVPPPPPPAALESSVPPARRRSQHHTAAPHARQQRHAAAGSEQRRAGPWGRGAAGPAAAAGAGSGKEGCGACSADRHTAVIRKHETYNQAQQDLNSLFRVPNCKPCRARAWGNGAS